jgi:hypothetical protein
VPNKTKRLSIEAERMQVAKRACEERGLTPERIVEFSPLACMLACMHQAYDEGNIQLAMACAASAAPYCHPRLTSSEVRISGELTHKSDTELVAEIASLEARIAAAQGVVH